MPNRDCQDRGGGVLRNPIAWGVLETPFPFFQNGPCGGVGDLRVFFDASAPFVNKFFSDIVFTLFLDSFSGPIVAAIGESSFACHLHLCPPRKTAPFWACSWTGASVAVGCLLGDGAEDSPQQFTCGPAFPSLLCLALLFCSPACTMASSYSPVRSSVPEMPSPVRDSEPPAPSPTVHVKEQSRPFWTGYQFKCDKQEQEYFERHKLQLVRAFQAWGIIRLIYDTLLPLGYLSRGLAASISVAYIPNVVITLIMLLMVSCTSRFRKYIVLIISMAFAVFAISAGALVFVQTDVLVDHALNSKLPRVVKHLGTDPEALQELEEYLKTGVSETAVREAAWNVLPQMLLLVHTGLWRSTMMSLLAIPIAFPVAMLAIPELVQRDFWNTLVIDLMIWGYLFGNLLMTTLNRRRSFLLEYCFQTALETAVAASRQADSILNHTLKNTMGDAAGNIEIFLDEVDSSTDIVHLRQSWASLRRGMRACQHRQGAKVQGFTTAGCAAGVRNRTHLRSAGEAECTQCHGAS